MKKKIGKICLLIYSFMFGCVNYVHAVDWNTLYGGNGKIIGAATYIAGWIRYAALAIAVGMLMIKGIQFLLAAPEGKAEIKKQMIPWTIGVIILFAFNVFLNVAADLGESFSKSMNNPTL